MQINLEGQGSRPIWQEKIIYVSTQQALGVHLLYCGSSREGGDVTAQMVPIELLGARGAHPFQKFLELASFPTSRLPPDPTLWLYRLNCVPPEFIG